MKPINYNRLELMILEKGHKVQINNREDHVKIEYWIVNAFEEVIEVIYNETILVLEATEEQAREIFIEWSGEKHIAPWKECLKLIIREALKSEGMELRELGPRPEVERGKDGSIDYFLQYANIKKQEAYDAATPLDRILIVTK